MDSPKPTTETSTTTNVPAPAPLETTLVSDLTPELLAKKIHRFLLLGNTLPEIYRDAQTQGISQTLWNEALKILHPRKKIKWGTFVGFLFLGGFFFVSCFLGYLYYRFLKTDFSRTFPQPAAAFFSHFQKTPLSFSRELLYGTLDQSLQQAVNPTEENKEPKILDIQIVDVPASLSPEIEGEKPLFLNGTPPPAVLPTTRPVLNTVPYSVNPVVSEPSET